MNTIFKIIVIGIGATLTMDAWSYIMKLFNIKSLDYKFVGRWIGNLTKGKFTHNKIFDTVPFPNELLIGWITHYLIGITFVFLLAGVYGKEWIMNPTLKPAIIIGLVTIVAPFFLMQPSFGFGIAGSKLPDPNTARFKSLIIHFVYGLGIYLSAMCLNKIIELIK
ncbi:MAG: DUF2938 domain-containing protein [Flavobacteriales bacterium]|nr:DUF2938 domain-containing protein [Flavobacteriales bacterium]